MSNSDLSETSAVILASGIGSRLGEKTKSTPKPLLMFDGKPYLSYLVDWLIRKGIEDIVLTAHTHADQILDFVNSQERYKEIVNVVVEKELRGNVVSAKAGLSAVRNPLSFLLTADSVWDIDLSDIYDQHVKNNAKVTVIVTTRPNFPNLGQVRVLDDGRICRLYEGIDTPLSESKDYKAASTMGMYLTDVSALLGQIREDDSSIEREPMSRLVPDVYAYLNEGFFLDYGTPENHDWLLQNPDAITKHMG